MTKEIKIPQISEDADEATVSKVYVSEGDTIKKGDNLIGVESDKAAVDIPNEEADGTVKEIKVSEGDTVKVGDVILTLETGEGKADEKKDTDKEEDDKKDEEEPREDKSEGSDNNKSDGKEDVKKSEEKEEDEDGDKEDQEEEDEKEEDEKDEDEEDDGEKKESEDDEVKEDEEKAEKPADKKDEDEGDEMDSEESDSKDEGAPAAPLAKKFARELGIEIEDLLGADPEKRVTREDVMAHARKLIQQKGTAAGGGGVQPIELPDFSKWGETEREPLSGIRAAVAKNTTLSWQNIPHVTQHDRADLTELQRFREKMAEKDRKLSITAIMAKICVAALEQFPRFNSSLDMAANELVLKKYINIGIAVDTDDGLLMPVIKNADEKSLDEINEELKNLAEKARNRKLKPDEMKGGNFTVSNLGGIGGSSFTPVIFPPQVAILGMSRSFIEPKWIEDEFVPAEMTTLSLSYDHRVIDGADAARFLRWICEVIEEPFNLLQ